MQWDSVSGATSYGLYSSKGRYGSGYIVCSNALLATSLTSFTLPSGILQNGVAYRWNMTTFNAAGEGSPGSHLYFQTPVALRSEERRVGKECRSRWSTYH